MHSILHTVNCPEDLKNLNREELERLSREIRETIVHTISRNGGHLASSLGAVELAIALHRVYDSPRDRIIWDVGHQSYAHKILTGRRESFSTIRTHDGLSGFPDPFESLHDPFSGGHAGTSISAALGMAVAGDLDGADTNVVAVIGDGSIGSGMAFEAMNHAGHLGTKLIVVLNDNGMAISPSIGSLCRLLNGVRNAFLSGLSGEKQVKSLPVVAMDKVALAVSSIFRNRISSLMLLNTIWDELGFNYIGPLDGHNIPVIESGLRKVQYGGRRPAIVHVITKKGKGYEPAERDAVKYHGISPKKNNPHTSYSQVFSRTLLRLMAGNEKIVAITAAMLHGTGLDEAAQQFPGRVFDVGICEQHAVTMAAGLATRGYIPVVAIYSAFLQRSYDQIINDVCLQQLPVIFAIDRAGIVGEDGKTHQGAFDISFLRSIPHMIVSAPKDEDELQHLLFTAAGSGRPMAVRYPRGRGEGVPLQTDFRELPIGRGELIKNGGDVAILAIGSTVYPAMMAAEQLAEMDIDCAVVNARFAKPLDEDLIIELARKTERILTVEDNAAAGGFGSAVMELLARQSVAVRIDCIGLPDRFIEHGPQEFMRAAFDLDADGIVRRVKQSFPALMFNVYDQKMENIS
ncbi:MAG: 1-deoxy-D-xylulose-5-phosphate synthase [Spirochaetes bacterium RBG_13_51_14]|nr:MAG: 1-deoxy-D-xylulose-5-phosphate synthase [Spirochaetes bacterium RBG_13_51_14]